MQAIQWICLLTLAGLLAICIWTDVTARRVPNVVVMLGMLTAIGVHTAGALLSERTATAIDLATPWLGALAGLVAMLPLHLMRACGAGDVKLFAMVGAYLGYAAVPEALLATLTAGGVLSIVCMVMFGVAKQAIENTRFLITDWLARLQGGSGASLAPLTNTAFRLPYVLAIAGGTLVYLARHGWQRSFAS